MVTVTCERQLPAPLLFESVKNSSQSGSSGGKLAGGHCPLPCSSYWAASAAVREALEAMGTSFLPKSARLSTWLSLPSGPLTNAPQMMWRLATGLLGWPQIEAWPAAWWGWLQYLFVLPI